MARLVDRNISRNVSEQELQGIFDKLVALRSKTDPQRGATASILKRNRAIEAMDLSMSLVRGLSGWAFDQLTGSAATPTKNPHWYGHEMIGQSIINRDLNADPRQSRILLAVMVRSFANLMPEATAKTLSEALYALNLGEVRPLLEAVKIRNHGKCRTVWKRQKEAVLRVAFLCARWETEDRAKPRAQRRRDPAIAAENLVAGKFKVDAGTLRKWRT